MATDETTTRKPTTLLSPTQSSKTGKYTFTLIHTHTHIYRQTDRQTHRRAAAWLALQLVLSIFCIFSIEKRCKKLCLVLGEQGMCGLCCHPFANMCIFFARFFHSKIHYFLSFFKLHLLAGTGLAAVAVAAVAAAAAVVVGSISLFVGVAGNNSRAATTTATTDNSISFKNKLKGGKKANSATKNHRCCVCVC